MKDPAAEIAATISKTDALRSRAGFCMYAYEKGLSQKRQPRNNSSAGTMEVPTDDDSIVRQMVECIKAYPGGKLEIIFGGGYLVEESV